MNSQGQAVGMVAAVFVLGVVSGAVVMHAFEAKLAAPPVISLDYKDDSHIALEQMTRELKLNEDQRSRVQAILDECIMEEADLLMKVRQVQQNGRLRILEALDPEQQTEFDALFREPVRN